MSVIELQDSGFVSRLSAAELSLVNYHSNVHADCIVMKPIFTRLSRDYPHVLFFLVDAVNAPITTKTVFLESMPYFALYRRGEKIEGLSTREERALRALLERHCRRPS